MLPVFLLADSRLPSGGHGHSGGVEALVDRGLLRTAEDLALFLEGRVRPAGGWSPPPRRRLRGAGCARGAGSGDPAVADAGHSCRLARTDADCADGGVARTPSAALRTASRAQGAALLRTVSLAFPTPAVAALRALPRVHHPLVLGAAAAAAGADPAQAAALALHHLVGGAATAAVRLLGLDPLRVTAVTAAVARSAEPVAADAATLGRPPSPRATRHCCRPRAAPSPTSWPNCTAHRRRPSLHRDDLLSGINGAARPCPADRPRRAAAVRIGIGGPVGGGKTALVAALCRTLRDRMSLAVVTNDIYTTEDADFLRRHGVLPDERIRAVQTGGCPHTAIRDDITANLDAVDELVARARPGPRARRERRRQPHGHVQLRARRQADLRRRRRGRGQGAAQGRPGRHRSDLLVINKTDLAPMVGADLDVMRTDAERLREDRPTMLVSLREQPDAGPIAEWVTALVRARRS